MSTTTPTRTSAVPAFTILRASVVATRRLTPHLVRLTFGGPELAWMTNGGLDQRIKLLFPKPGQSEPVLPEFERTYPALRDLPEDVRPHIRTYTVRAHRPELGEFDVDVVLHGDAGPGSSFAMRARPGDRLAAFVPHVDHPHASRVAGVEFRMDRVHDDVVLIGDETALPAIGSVLDALPAGVGARALVEVPEAADARYLDSATTCDVRWLTRGDGRHGTGVLDAVRELDLGDPYVWVAGESRTVTSVRRVLVDEFGLDRSRITFMGYWRHGSTEDSDTSARPAAPVPANA